MYSRIKGLEDCESVSRIRVKGETASRRLRRREIRRRLCVRRWSSDSFDGIVADGVVQRKGQAHGGALYAWHPSLCMSFKSFVHYGGSNKYISLTWV
jgi:hypothetical protein